MTDAAEAMLDRCQQEINRLGLALKVANQRVLFNEVKHKVELDTLKADNDRLNRENNSLSSEAMTLRAVVKRCLCE